VGHKEKTFPGAENGETKAKTGNELANFTRPTQSFRVLQVL